jgi:hypothetical protein
MLDPRCSPTQRNAIAGATMKTPMNSPKASTIESAIWRDDSCTSSGEACVAEIDSARMPIVIACPSAITPRNPGLRRIRYRSAIERIGCDSRWIDSSGRRTASAQTCRPRIITPSMTAWPP